MRIISLVPSQTETLFALGVGDQIVARTRFCRLPEEAKSIPHVGGTKNPRLESILKLDPDVVLMDVDENRKEDAQFLQQHGIRLFASLPKTIDDVINMITYLGSLLSVAQNAARICDEIQARASSFRPPQRYKTLVLIWPRPYMTVNNDTYVCNIARFFGFDCLFGDHQQRYPRITEEQIRNSQAEAILLPTDPYPYREKHLMQLKASFPDLPAVKNRRILIADGTYFTWHGYATLRALKEFPEEMIKTGWQT